MRFSEDYDIYSIFNTICILWTITNLLSKCYKIFYNFLNNIINLKNIIEFEYEEPVQELVLTHDEPVQELLLTHEQEIVERARLWRSETKYISILLYKTYKKLSHGPTEFDILRELIVRQEYKRLNNFKYDLGHAKRNLILYNALSETSQSIMSRYIYFDINYLRACYNFLKEEKRFDSRITTSNISNDGDVVLIHPQNLETLEDLLDQLSSLEDYELLKFVPNSESKLFTNSSYNRRIEMNNDDTYCTDQFNPRYFRYTNFDNGNDEDPDDQINQNTYDDTPIYNNDFEENWDDFDPNYDNSDEIVDSDNDHESLLVLVYFILSQFL